MKCQHDMIAQQAAYIRFTDNKTIGSSQTKVTEQVTQVVHPRLLKKKEFALHNDLATLISN